MQFYFRQSLTKIFGKVIGQEVIQSLLELLTLVPPGLDIGVVPMPRNVRIQQLKAHFIVSSLCIGIK